ncbi:MAG: hypothetical protein COB83_04965 [Gammaproteobacteria bacterium]|nr:MAG: hypothetical protein COB83_04965 [Gammaproteobacteria bacterium]
MNDITSTSPFIITSGNNQNLQINTEQTKISDIDAQLELLTQMTQDKSSTSLSNRLDPLLKRLRLDLQQTLIDSNLAFNFSLSGDDSINYLNNLDDEKLSKVMSVIQTLSMDPEVTGGTVWDVTNRREKLQRRSEGLITTLKDLDEKTQIRVLDKMLEYGKDVVVTSLTEPDTYNLKTLTNTNKDSSTKANDIQNLLYLISRSDDVNKTLNKVEQFTETQQNDALFILTSLPEKEAERVFSLLDDKSEETQNEILNYFGKISERINPLFSIISKTYAEGKSVYSNTMIDYRYTDETKSLLNNSLSLFENFQFEEENLNQIFDDASDLNFIEKRAFITLSLTGFELLEGNTGNATIPTVVSDENSDIMQSLRQNSSLLNLVNDTAFGQESEYSRGMFLMKDSHSAKTDQQELIKVITLYTKLNVNSDDLSQRSQQFIDNLLNQEPDSRDVLIDELLNFTPSDLSIIGLSDEALTNSLKDFKAASNSISYSQDINALLNLVPKSLPEITIETAKSTKDKEQITNFWQAMGFSEKKIDLLVDVLKGQSQALRLDIISEISHTIERINVGEISKQDGIKWFDEFLEKLSNHLAK